MPRGNTAFGSGKSKKNEYSDKYPQTGRPTSDTPSPNKFPVGVTANPDGTITEVKADGKAQAFTQEEQAKKNAINMGGSYTQEQKQQLGANPPANPTKESMLRAEIADELLRDKLRIQMQSEQLQQPTADPSLISDVGNYAPLPADNAGSLGTNIKGIIPEVISDMGSSALIGATSVGTIGAGIGALAGGVGAIPGAGIGAGAGAVAGAVKSLFTSIGTLKSEMRQSATEQKAEFTASKTAIRDIIKSVNQGYPYAPGEAEELFEYELAKIDRAEMNLKQLSEKNWLSKAKDDLIKVETWNKSGKARAIRDMQTALIKPNPNAPLVDYLEPQEVLE